MFFILGNPRSGTSLFRLMLNSHPQITVPPECGFLQWWHEKYQNWNKESCLDSRQVSEFIRDLKSSKKIEDWNLDYTNLSSKIRSEQPASFAELVLLVYQVFSKPDTLLIGDKNNYYIHHIPTLKELFKGAKFLHLVRDGRDVAVSYKEINTSVFTSKYAPSLPTSTYDIAKEWSENVLKIQREISDRDHFMLRYEDLISSPQDHLTNVCLFLGIPYSPEMLKFYEPQNHDEPTTTMEWKSKTTTEVDSSNTGKYKSQLKADDLNTFIELAGPTLKAFGYE